MYYFASDVHLGVCDSAEAKATEKRFIEWLNFISGDAKAIFLDGDIFDFWFEYRNVVPKGYVRTLSKLASLAEQGVRVVFMCGNHDMWVRDYFTAECGVEIYRSPLELELAGKKIYLAHGDNLNMTGHFSLRLLNGFFRSKVARTLFSWLLHPDLALAFGRAWSAKSRKKHVDEWQAEVCQEPHRGVYQLLDYAREMQSSKSFDYYIFGHMHYAMEQSEDGFKVLLMNDWKREPHYVVVDAEGSAELKKFEC